MIKTMIVEAFINATDVHKANMLRNLSVDLLGVGGEIYPHLGNSKTVWQAYVNKVGPHIIEAMPPNHVKKYILPLIESGDVTTLATLLGANMFLDEVFEVLPGLILKAGPMLQISNLGSIISQSNELALPLILDLFKLRSMDIVLFAFSTFDHFKWKDERAKVLLEAGIYALLVNTTEERVAQACSNVLQTLNPVLFLKSIMEELTSIEAQRRNFWWHLRPYVNRMVLSAYASVTDSDLKRDFVMVSLFHGIIWEYFDYLDALKLMVLRGDEFKRLITEGSHASLEALGMGLYDASVRKKIDVTTITDVLTRIINQLLDDGYSLRRLVSFLNWSKDSFPDADFVEFLIKGKSDKKALGKLSELYSYPHSSAADVTRYMKRLTGLAKTDAAIEILDKLIQLGDVGFVLFPKNYEAAMKVLISAMSRGTLSVRPWVVKSIKELPWDRLGIFIPELLEKSAPYWAVQLAHYVLQIDPQHELAAQKFAELMMSDDVEVQDYINNYVGQEFGS